MNYKKLLIMIILVGVLFSFNSEIFAETTTSMGVKYFNQLNLEDSGIYYGPVGSINLTENLKIRGSYLINSHDLEKDRIGVDSLYLFDMGIKTYLGTGISQIRVKNFMSFMVGTEISLFRNIKIFGDGGYIFPLSHRDETESSFIVSTGMEYSF